jgi:hypothetical protein
MGIGGVPALLVVAALAGCSASPPTEPAGNEPPIQLTATLDSPIDITLTWTIPADDAAGRVVEFATEPGGKYTILKFVPPNQTTFTHPDLMPETSFYYRVRPFYGPASPEVDIALPAGGFDQKAENDDHAWAYPRAVPDRSVATRPVRATDAAAATPTDFRGAVVHANGIKFTWADRASDEEGYLLEVKPVGKADFRVVAVLDPNINSFGLITLPTEKAASYRVRAFYYGKSSNVVTRTTGPEPTPGT